MKFYLEIGELVWASDVRGQFKLMVGLMQMFSWRFWLGQRSVSVATVQPLSEATVFFSQDNNQVVRKWGTERHEEKLYNHVDLVEMLGIADVEKGQYFRRMVSQVVDAGAWSRF